MMVCILIAFNWNAMVTLMSLGRDKIGQNSTESETLSHPRVWCDGVMNANNLYRDSRKWSFVYWFTASYSLNWGHTF